MEAREWRTADKAEWGSGPWQDEPDKAQWVDEATGLPCLIVRNHSGALCGYVGVPEGHPWHGKDYDDRPIEVHGGLTFASGCHSATTESFERMRTRIPAAKIEAKKYPVGDSAQWLRDWVPVLDSFEAFKARVDATAVCHIGEPDNVWWFGFDCSHAGDASPAYDRRWSSLLRDGAYRDLAYVKREIAGLAKQLANAA